MSHDDLLCSSVQDFGKWAAPAARFVWQFIGDGFAQVSLHSSPSQPSESFPCVSRKIEENINAGFRLGTAFGGHGSHKHALHQEKIDAAFDRESPTRHPLSLSSAQIQQERIMH